MTVITEDYRQVNKELHDRDPAYGISGRKWAPKVLKIAQALGTTDILDYGCGRRTLEAALGFGIRNYDPCIPGFDASPEPAELVVCTDVLEHIEPECLDGVLDDLKRVVGMAGFFSVDTRPARKFLADGRNAHLIQKPAEWWFPRFFERWALVEIQDLLFKSQTGALKSLGFAVIVRGQR